MRPLKHSPYWATMPVSSVGMLVVLLLLLPSRTLTPRYASRSFLVTAATENVMQNDDTTQQRPSAQSSLQKVQQQQQVNQPAPSSQQRQLPVHQHTEQHATAAAAQGAKEKQVGAGGGGAGGSGSNRMLESRNSYAVLSQAMSQAVNHEFGTYGSGSADGACSADDMDCIAHHDHLGMEAIRSLHRQLDDDDNGDIDLSESDDFLREELKYDSGYEKRHKAFHFNDDMHISVKELWEAWLRSEVHNWTVDQTTEWLAQSVQLPQYVHLFRLHKVTGKVLPRLAVNNMHYVSNVLGIKDPIHKQKIALKAMDAVLFGPPRETGTRWKDLLLVTLLLTAIIGSWYAYQQNKNAKAHLKRMAKDVEGLLKAEVALKDMQKELERARMEQENVGKEKMDLERRLREAPTLSSSNSDLELQQLKQEIEMLRSELSRAEVEINDHCWTPPQGLQNWLQLTYELENKQHIRKRMMAEKQLMSAREACEKLKKKRSSLVGAFVSTHGKSIDDVDRSIVEARNALNDVTNDLQERMYRWKQIEQLLGFSIVNNNGLAYLENLLYNRNGVGAKSYRSRLSSSQDDLDDDSVQGMYDGICRSVRDDSSASDDGDRDTVTFILGGGASTSNLQLATFNPLNSGIVSAATAAAYMAGNAGNYHQQLQQHHPLTPITSHSPPPPPPLHHSGSHSSNSLNHSSGIISSTTTSPTIPSSPSFGQSISQVSKGNSINDSSQSLQDESLISSSSNERIVPTRVSSVTAARKAPVKLPAHVPTGLGKTPMPPPRKTLSSQSLFSMVRTGSGSDMVSLESAALSVGNPSGGSPAGIPALSASSIGNAQSISYASPYSTTGGTIVSSGSTHGHAGLSAVQLQQFADSAADIGAVGATAANGGAAVIQRQQILLQGTAPGAGAGTGAAAAGAAGVGPDVDTYSTDSSTIDEDVKRRRRKLHFPFGKKFSKSSSSSSSGNSKKSQ